MSHYTGSVPNTTEPARAWLRQALCATDQYAQQRDLWFAHPTDHTGRAKAAAVCAACPVRMACLIDALREEGGRHVDTRYGIRGGLTGKQRRSLYEKQRARRKKAREARKAVAV